MGYVRNDNQSKEKQIDKLNSTKREPNKVLFFCNKSLVSNVITFAIKHRITILKLRKELEKLRMSQY